MQYAMAKILEAIYEADFLPMSYGDCPGRGPRDAVKDLTDQLQFGRYNWVVDTEIKGFFDNLDHEWILRMLQERIDDKAFLNLIRAWLKAGILDTEGQVVHPVTGTPQGGIVSPIFANIYLHYVLDQWFDKRVKPRAAVPALIIRYADDFVCAFRHRRDAEASSLEEPGAGKLHAGLCEGAAGQPAVLPRFTHRGRECGCNEL